MQLFWDWFKRLCTLRVKSSRTYSFYRLWWMTG